jgi:hypothetical protein
MKGNKVVFEASDIMAGKLSLGYLFSDVEIV